MDISSYFPSDGMNKFNTLFLFITSHNLGKNATLSSLASCGIVESKLDYSYILTEVTPVCLIEHRYPAYRILAETLLITYLPSYILTRSSA